MTDKTMTLDSLAQEIRRVDGNHSLGAGALAEALMPFINRHLSQPAGDLDDYEVRAGSCRIIGPKPDVLHISRIIGEPEQPVELVEAVEKAGAAFCIWSQDSDDSDTWTTGCRNVFLINDGTPAENDMRFCCYCGMPVEQHLCTIEDDRHD